ncbi:hypothetical protein N9378_00470 [Flavobacteriaceae bacterium]|nr:hypothetical protein [Flavobacteriaceae bacterium]
MAQSGTKAPAGRTLDYGLDASTLNRVRDAGLASANLQSMKGGGRVGLAQALGEIGKGVQLIGGGLKAGKEASKLLNAKWQNAESTGGWGGAKPELKEQMTTLEKENQAEYQAAVQAGDRTKQAEILARQAQRVEQFGKHNALGALVLSTRKDVGFIDNNEAYSLEDQLFLSSYADPTEVMVIPSEGGVVKMGVDYTDFFKPISPEGTTNEELLESVEAANIRDAQLEELLADPNSGYTKVDGKIIRSLTTSEITDMLGNATRPTTEALQINKEFDRMIADRLAINKANIGVEEEKQQTYAFSDDQVSAKFGEMINEGNQKKLIYAKLDGVGTFSKEFMLHPDFKSTTFDPNIGMPVPDGATENGPTFADIAGPDKILQASEMVGLSPNDRALILKELQKPGNENMLREYWGEWVMLKSKGKMGLGGVNTTTDTMTAGAGSINVTNATSRAND